MAKERKSTSFVWNHFERDHNAKIAKCNYCKNILSYKSTITNLKHHLKKKHSDAYDELMKGIKLERVENENTMDYIGEKEINRSNIAVWDYFTKSSSTKTGQCHVCKKHLSYKSTISNLKNHLKMHPHVHDEYIKSSSMINTQTHNPTISRRKSNKTKALWEFYEKDSTSSIKAAECKMCHKSLIFKTSITNLKQHLKIKHPDAYNKLKKRESVKSLAVFGRESDDSDSGDDYSSQSGEEDVEESLKLCDVWNYFEDDGEERSRCVVCRANVGHEYEELKAHLKDNHPNLLLQIMQNKETNSDAGSNADDDNTFTEVVYLEQDTLAEDIIAPKETPKPKLRAQRIASKREPRESFHETPKKRRQSYERRNSSEDVPRKRQKEDVDEDNELASFIKYITCLLKKLSPDVFSKVQIDIINTILKANTNVAKSTTLDSSPRIILNNELPQISAPNVITVNEITPVNNSAMLGHNYTITVAAKNGQSESNNMTS